MNPRSRTTTPRNKPKTPAQKQQLITEADAFDPNSALFETLMSDPIKRQLILNLISSEKSSIQAYMAKEKAKSAEAANQSPLGKVKQKYVLESPTALMRRRALEKLEKAKMEGPNSNNPVVAKKVNLPILPYEKLLKGVRAYVEVISKNEDRSAGVKALLISMGAIVREEFTKDVTHVIFKDGSFSTYERARILNKHVVSVLWLDAVRNTRTRVSEKSYPAIGAVNYNQNVSAVCEKFENNYEEIISSEMKKKNPMKGSDSGDSLDSSEIIPCSQSDDASPILSRTISRKSRRTVNKNCDIIESDAESDCGIIDGVPYSKRSKSLCSKSKVTPVKNKILPKTPQTQPRNRKTSKLQKPAEEQLETPTTKIPERNSSEDFVPQSSETQPKNRRRTLYKDTTSDIIQQLKAKSKRKSLYVSPLNNCSGKTPTRNTLAAVRSNLCSELKEVDSSKDCESDSSKIVLDTEKSNSEGIKARESLESVATTVSEEFGFFVTRRKPRVQSEESSFKKTNEICKNSLVEDLSYLQLSSDISTNVSLESHKSSLSTVEIIPSLQISQNEISLDNNSLSQNLSSLRLSSSCTNQQESGNNINIENVIQQNSESMDFLLISAEPTNCDHESNAQVSIEQNELVEDTTNEGNSDLQGDSNEQSGNVITTVSGTSKDNENTDIIHTQVDKKAIEINVSEIENLDTKNNMLNEPVNRETPTKRIPRRRTSRFSTNPDTDVNKVVPSRKSMRLQNKINKCLDKLSESIENENYVVEPIHQEISESVVNNNTKLNDNVTNAPEKQEQDKQKLSSPITGEESSESVSGGTRRRRKLYRMNQTIDEEVRKKTEEENEKLKQQKLEKFKEPTQPLPPFILTNNAKQYIQKRMNELRSSGDEDDLPNEPKKRICKEKPTKKLNESADEQRDLLSELVNTKPDEAVVHTNVLKSPRKVTSQSKRKTSLVCTRFHRNETVVFQEIVTKLGCFDLERDVTNRTSHLIVGECKRTINILRAMARGIWILKADWLYESMEKSKWLPEEDYELTEFSAAVQQCRIEREAFGPSFSMDIFQNCGPIYVTKGTAPKLSELEELIVLCKGKIVTSAKNAKIIIGMASNNENAIGVKETWILDSIMLNKCKNIKDYTIQHETNRKSDVV